MVTPFRDAGPPAPLKCPRCKKRELPAVDVAACPARCGTWVSTFAASEVLTEIDRRPDPMTRWWRMREPCPVCGEKMLLYGDDPALLQGCELHGYFIDADTIAKTGLARGVDLVALERKRDDPSRIDAEREHLLRVEQERAHEAAERERAERELAKRQADREKRLLEQSARDQRAQRIYDLLLLDNRTGLVEYLLALEDRIAALEKQR